MLTGQVVVVLDGARGAVGEGGVESECDQNRMAYVLTVQVGDCIQLVLATGE